MSGPGDDTDPPFPNQLARWAFGGPIGPRDYAALRSAWEQRGLVVDDADLETTQEELRVLTSQDRDLMLASRRWRPGQPDPALFCAGDVVALRALAAYGALREAEVVLDPRLTAMAGPSAETSRSALRGHLSYARMLYQAQPFFLPAATAVGLMASHPPDDAGVAELRLPFQSVAVYFGADLNAGDDTLIWPPDTQSRLAEAQAFLPSQLGLGPEQGQTITTNLARLGSYVTGVVLFSGPDGGLADEMLWLLGHRPRPRQRRGAPRPSSRSPARPSLPSHAGPPGGQHRRRSGVGALAGRSSPGPTSQGFSAVAQGSVHQPVPQARAPGRRRRRARPRRRPPLGRPPHHRCRPRGLSCDTSPAGPLASGESRPARQLASRVALVPRHGGQPRRPCRHQAQGLPPAHAGRDPLPPRALAR